MASGHHLPALLSPRRSMLQRELMLLALHRGERLTKSRRDSIRRLFALQ